MPPNPLNDRSIFLAAIDIASPAERDAYLIHVCGENAPLRASVQALLSAHDQSGDLLDAADQATRTTAEPTEHLGTQIGPYKLLQQIGEGGMGVVYMAEQTEPVQRKVALKVIKPGMDSRQVIARFEAERQALAMMDHVNIARVLDAGTTNQGRPYFVMELVHGVPITKYCDDNRLTPRQRLELFVPVCQAIQHAHQKGIIHRDIKPSNVMVTLYDGKPVPKVIDFGVAKATEQKLTERTLFTQYGTMVGTLEYMSPEQAEMSALGVDTRSDVFSLGVLLYELLTGSTPLSSKRMKEAAYGEILRLIKEEEPPKPSTRLSDSGEALASISAQRHTEPAKLSKLMRGELDWIVMKTLEKDRNRRYETAKDFAADVQRYLSDEPVAACPPTAMYRFHKFARRNSRILATVGLVTFLLVTGTLMSAWQAIRATQAERQANANNETAQDERQKAQDQLLLTEQAKEKGRLRLFESQLSQAQAGSLSRRAGQRLDSLDALSAATALARELKLPADSDLPLRNAAIACMALSDLRLAKEWDGFPYGSAYLDFDGNLERYARGDVQGAVSIRRVVDDTEIASLPPVGAKCGPLLSRNGKFIAVHSPKGLQLWSLGEPKPVLVFDLPAENAIVVGMDFSPDGQKYVINQADGLISVIDLVSGKPLRRLSQRNSGRQIAINNQQIAISCNTAVEIRDLHSGDVAATLQQPPPVNDLVWHPNGKILAVACNNSQVILWDTTTGKQSLKLEGFKNGGIRMGFSHSGDLLATTGWECKLRLWDSRTGRQLFCMTRGDGGIPRFSENDRYLSSLSNTNGKLGLWEIAECKEYRTLVHASRTPDLPYFNSSVCGDGRLLAVGTYGGVGLWELSSGRELQFLELPGINNVGSDSSGALLTNGAAGLFRWEVRRDPSAPHKFRVGPRHKLSIPGSIHDIACSHNGRVIASAQWAGGMVLHVDRLDPPVPLLPHDEVRYVSVSSDGTLVATASHSSVKIWNAETGKPLRTLPVLGWRGTFSPDGKWLATVLGGCQLWKVDTWEEGPKIGGGEGVAFSPDTDTSILAVESGEGSIRLVDPKTGTEFARLEDPQQDRAKHITFSPDGSQLIATNEDSRSIHVWDLRLIRRQLAKRGLDWNLPPYSPLDANDGQPLIVELDVAVADNPKQATGFRPAAAHTDP